MFNIVHFYKLEYIDLYKKYKNNEEFIKIE